MARSEDKAGKLPVALEVEAENDDVKSEPTSYIERELRSLGDVELVAVESAQVPHAAGRPPEIGQ